MSQHISTVGQIATVPRLFTPENGVQFCTFRLASTERRFDAGRKEWVDGDTNWFTVNTFRSLAVHASESFSKGDRVVVAGRLRVRRWETDEKKGNSVEIDVDGIGHDIRWGVSTFTKRNGQQGATAADPGALEDAPTGDDAAAAEPQATDGDAFSPDDSQTSGSQEPSLAGAPF